MRLFACFVMAALAVFPVHSTHEIAYDDGTAERTIVWAERGNGVAVRFSVDPGESLLGARFFIGAAPFWNALGICVLNANGPDGAPGDTLVSYFEQPLEWWSGFQGVTFPAPIELPDTSFYVVYLQTRSGSGDSDTFGIDTSSSPDGRSWIFQDGVWTHMDSKEGDVMIRAIVSAPTPVTPSTWGEIKALYR